MDTLVSMNVFRYVVEVGSFVGAAERMQMSAAMASKHVMHLEQQLGARLLHRTTRRVAPTEAGREYYERLVQALSELDEAGQAVGAASVVPQGRLRVTSLSAFGLRHVMQAVTDYAGRFPDVTVDMTLSDRVVDLIEEGYDLGIRIGALPDSASLVARRLGLQTMGIGASPAYIAAHGRPQTLDEMRQHVGVAYARGGVEKGWSLMEADGEVVQLRVPPRLRMDDLQAIADAAIAGAGLAWLPCWMLSHYVRTGELDVLMHGDRMAAQPVHAVWPQARYLPSKTRTAIDALAERVPAMLATW